MKINPNLNPIVFGITGHRDLRVEDISILKEQIKNIFREKKEEYPEALIMLLTPLAEGADRLAAEAALELGGVELIVLLPMVKEEYMKDFETQYSKDEFEMLLSKADKWFELPLVEGNTFENIQQQIINRGRQYEQVGAYIACHSHILMALWDGTHNNLMGGTSHIVKLKGAGKSELHADDDISSLKQVENGLVYHILTPRRSNPQPNGELFELKIIYPNNNKSNEENKECLKKNH